jgi:hydrogenase nickel incorporation protein HypA/HybF
VHELSLVEGILKAALEEAKRDGQKQIKEIHATIRESGHPMEADSLQSMLEMLAKGTIAQDAEIEIKLVPPTLKCRECNLTFSAQGHSLMCPRCQSGRLEELDAEKIDLECSFSG